MELVTKILSSNFFTVYTDMIRITNRWVNGTEVKEKLDFSGFVKKRLLLLSKFQFKPIKHFNLSLCLRLQFLLQNHLISWLDEKSLQVYNQYLCKEHKKLIFSIIQNDKNLEIVLEEMNNQNYAYLEFLVEIFYALKNNVDFFIKIQALITSLGFNDFLFSIINQIEFRAIDGLIFLEIKNKHFQERSNFLRFLELVMFFIFKNKNCLTSKIFPPLDAGHKPVLLTFLITMLFQNTFTKSNVFVLRILEIVFKNIIELSDNPQRKRKYFATLLMDVVDQYNLYNHDYFFLIFEMLINNNELDVLKIISSRADLWVSIINNMSFSSKKTICTSLVKISSCLLTQLDIWPSNNQFSVLLNTWVKYIKKQKYNMLTSCIFEVLQKLNDKSTDRIKTILTESDCKVLKSLVRQSEEVSS